MALRKNKFKEAMAGRDTFYKPSEMEKIYPGGKKKKSESGKDKKVKKTQNTAFRVTGIVAESLWNIYF